MIPFEIKKLIVDDVALWDHQDDSIATLKACAQASRAFAAVSKPHLFRTITIPHRTEGKNLPAYLRLLHILQESPETASYVRELHIIDSFVDTGSDESPAVLGHPAFPDFIRSFVNIKSLEVGFAKIAEGYWEGIPIHARDALASVFALPSLEYVSLQHIDGFPCELMRMILVQIKSLRLDSVDLDWSSDDDEFEVEELDTDLDKCLGLKKLILHSTNVEEIRMESIIQLIINPRCNLEELICTRAQEEDWQDSWDSDKVLYQSFYALMASHNSSLAVLQFPRYRNHHYNDAPNLRTFTHLTSIRLFAFMCWDGYEGYETDIPDIAKFLEGAEMDNQIQELEIEFDLTLPPRCDLWVPLAVLDELLSSARFAKLLHVNITIMSDGNISQVSVAERRSFIRKKLPKLRQNGILHVNKVGWLVTDENHPCAYDMELRTSLIDDL